ncbi:microfibril-associated glycoprotein 4-like [Solea solea]|uniref:microfibril-associated glycoprotein 4-like n=1 Tax=Solea solea TaxID=90069 RepID=UPI00272A63C7|nr:microfibril-associated glycoprotein 4-like [Solea solea]
MMGFILLLALIPAAICAPVFRPDDCTDVYNGGSEYSGVYSIYTTGRVRVYCDMGSDEESVKWTVIQRRKDGTVNFYYGWDQYRTGFGEPSGEFWLGLENIHVLTQRKSYELRVDMEDFEGNKAYVYYSTFSVGPEEDGYRLQVGGFRNGRRGDVAGDSLIYHDGMKFSTFDKDQDLNGQENCAGLFRGGWWYNNCHYANPNGVYFSGHDSPYGMGINWTTWRELYYSLKSIEMKIRPKE